MSPKSLRLTLGSKIILEIHINHMMYRKNLEKFTDLRSQKKWVNLEIRTAAVSDSQMSETSYFDWKMHLDEYVESIADSDLEDGELQKC